jgi:membrane protein DedA with SNARE-associated domain
MDNFIIIMIFIGVGIVIGIGCTYFLICCSNNYFLTARRETNHLTPERISSTNPMFREKSKEESSISEDPVVV